MVSNANLKGCVWTGLPVERSTRRTVGVGFLPESFEIRSAWPGELFSINRVCLSKTLTLSFDSDRRETRSACQTAGGPALPGH